MSKCRKIGNADTVQKMQTTELVGNGWSNKESHTKRGSIRNHNQKKKKKSHDQSLKTLPHKSMCHPCGTCVFYSHSKESHQVNHCRTN